ncbi:carbohydrate binding domain-containing protein [Pseudomonas sp. S1_E04]
MPTHPRHPTDDLLPAVCPPNTPIPTAPQRLEDLDHPYSAFPSVPLLSTPYPENGVYGLGIRHVRPYALFVFESWFVQVVNDYFAIYLGNLVFPAAEDLVTDPSLNRHVLAVPEERMPEGEVQTYGRVLRAGSGNESTSPVQTILIKTSRPGGTDIDPGSPWHTGLVMSVEGFPEGSSIGAGDVSAGLWCLINRYENIRKNDVIELSWDGIFVLHTVSPDEAAGSGAVRVFVPKSVIDQGGQLGTLTLRFRVRDVVENFSGEKYQYSKPYFLVAELDSDLLGAPIFLVDNAELESRQIDFDTQSDAHFDVLALTPREFPTPNPRHQIIVTLLGLLADGSTHSFVLDPVNDSNFGFTYVPIDRAIIAQLVGGSFRVSFSWQTADGVPKRQSGSITITVVGTQVLMPAPAVSPIELGLIPAGENITVTIPHYEPHNPGWLETLVIEYAPTGGGGAIIFTQPQLAGSQGGTRTVTAAELHPFIGLGPIKISYETNDGAAHIFGGNALAIRRSLMLGAQVGERIADLPAPRLQGAIGNNVDPADVPGSEVLVTFTYLGTLAGDKLHWSCIGSGLGGSASGTLDINAATAGRELPYPVTRDILDKNNNGSLRISYSLERPGTPPLVLRSEVLELTVGKGVELNRPIIEGASTFPDELNPLAVLAGAKVIVGYRPMLATDEINVDWLSIDGIGSITQPVQGNPSTHQVSVLIDSRTIAKGIRESGNLIHVQYRFNRGTFPYASETVALRLLPLTGLPTPYIEGINGPILDLSQLSPTARTHISVWNFIHANQRMWMTYDGTYADDTPYTENTYTANLVTAEGAANGISPPTPVDQLKLLKDGSTLTIRFWVSLAESISKSTAVLFGVRQHVIQAVPGILPHPFIGGASGTGPSVTVAPLTIEHNTTVTVRYDGMSSNDRITLTWVFADCTTHDASLDGQDGGTVVFNLTNAKVLHRSVNSTVMLRYSIVRHGGAPIPSEVQTVTVSPIPNANLPRPLINGVADNGTLDLSTFAGNALAAVAKWPLSATGQRVWLTCSSADVADLKVLDGVAITSVEAANGLVNKTVLRNWLGSIASSRHINVAFHVAFDGTYERISTFPQTNYVLRSLPDITNFEDGKLNNWTVEPAGAGGYIRGAVGSKVWFNNTNSASGNIFNGYVLQKRLTTVPGKKYRISITARQVNVGTVTPKLRVTVRYSSSATVTLSSPDWVTISHTATAEAVPNNRTFFSVFSEEAAWNGNDYEIGSLTIEEV